MKNIYFLFLFLSLTFASCKKVESDVYNYYPVVQTLSATVLADGSVEVTAEIQSEGTEPLEYFGFCLDTQALPKMLSNQSIASGMNGNKFSCIYSGLNTTSTYYFRSWATNANGYSYGNVISLDSIEATPVVAPCSPSMNTLNLGAGGGTEYFTIVGTPTFGVSSWDFQAQTSGGIYNFAFGSMPSTGIYISTTSSSPPPGSVYIYFYSGIISGALSSGSSVYVNQMSPGSWEMTICNAPWIYNSSTFHMTAKFTCPL